MPPQQRFRRGDLCEDFPAELLRFRCKPSSLIVGKSKTSTSDLLTRNENGFRRGRIRAAYHARSAIACPAERESSFWTLRDLRFFSRHRLQAAYFGVSLSSLLVQGVLGLGLPVPLSVS